jgi:hypothetical protein
MMHRLDRFTMSRGSLGRQKGDAPLSDPRTAREKTPVLSPLHFGKLLPFSKSNFPGRSQQSSLNYVCSPAPPSIPRSAIHSKPQATPCTAVEAISDLRTSFCLAARSHTWRQGARLQHFGVPLPLVRTSQLLEGLG